MPRVGVYLKNFRSVDVKYMYMWRLSPEKNVTGLVMVFKATFNNISVIYSSGQFYWWRKPE
jgi:hypothetical protein